MNWTVLLIPVFVASVLLANTYEGRVSNHKEPLGYVGIRTEGDKGKRTVERVRHWSPADCAGIKPNDVVVACNGVEGGPIIGEPYKFVSIEVLRKGERLTFYCCRLPMKDIKEREQRYYYDCGFEDESQRPAFTDSRAY